MKRFLLLLVVLAAGGAAVYFFLLTPEKRACAKMVELCGGGTDSKAFDQCQEDFAKLKRSDAKEAGNLAQCITESTTCGAAIGCQAGSMMNMGLNFGKGLLDGLGKSLSGSNKDK